MPCRALIFQHVEGEHPTSLTAHLLDAGVDADLVRLDAGQPIPDLAPYQLLLVFGGEMNVWQESEYPWLIEEKAAIRDWVRPDDRPYLGVCLGHQLLADALGGQVGPMATPEVGLEPVQLSAPGRAAPLFAGLGAELVVPQWHGAEVRRAPEASTVLATNPAAAIQALRVGEVAYGIQFHAEISPAEGDHWMAHPSFQALVADRAASSGIARERFDAAVARRATEMEATTARLAANLLALVDHSSVAPS